MKDLKQAQIDEEAKLRVRNEALSASRQVVLIREAASTAYGQATAMLQRLASPQLTHAIVGIFLEDLQHLPDEQQTALRKAAAMLIAASGVEIITAHPLATPYETSLIEALNTVTGKNLSFTLHEDSSLIAGLRVVVGECQLHANLADEMAFFRRQNNHD
jgi:F-type H+-transporting ATPase subunit b